MPVIRRDGASSREALAIAKVFDDYLIRVVAVNPPTRFDGQRQTEWEVWGQAGFIDVDHVDAKIAAALRSL